MDRMIKIKICGITSVGDAQMVAEAGVDAMGLVFYENSPRHVSIEMAQRIIQNTPPFMTVVGLFVNPEKQFVAQVLSTVPLHVLQFHGEETDAFCAQFGRSYIKAVRVQSALDIEQAVFQYPAAAAILLDAYHPSLAGGTGQTFDWSIIPDNFNKPLILAGGLNADNVDLALTTIRPYAVDVSSGVEACPGVKSLEKIQAFCQAVHHGG